MSKTIGGTTTQFLYDRLNPVQELNGTGGVTANLLTGLRVDEYFTRTASGSTSMLLADALGSTIGLVGSSSTVATSYTYQPFGATTTGGAGNTNPYQFTGRENDGTGLYFYRARYYSPAFQRFVSQDPLDFGGGDSEPYAYVFNDPSDEVDQLGLGRFYPGPYPWGQRGPREFWQLPPKSQPPTDIRPLLPRNAPNCTRPPLVPVIPFPVDPFPWVIPIQPFCDQFPGLCGPPMA